MGLDILNTIVWIQYGLKVLVTHVRHKLLEQWQHIAKSHHQQTLKLHPHHQCRRHHQLIAMTGSRELLMNSYE